MNAVIYARFSCSKQREESIEGQIRMCTEYAKRNGIDIVGTYIDRAKSGRTDNRPQFRKMAEDSDSGLFDAILVWKLDRFSRNQIDSAVYKKLLSKNKIKILSATENIPEDASGIMLIAVLEGMAEYYSADLSEKVLRGHHKNALKCKSNGGTLPFGYTLDNEKHFVIDPNTAPYVLSAFQMYVDGLTMKEIANNLNFKGVLNTRGTKFTINSVSKMLSNIRYTGMYKYRKIEKPDGIPRIVPDELFNRVQELNLIKSKKFISIKIPFKKSHLNAHTDYKITYAFSIPYMCPIVDGKFGGVEETDDFEYIESWISCGKRHKELKYSLYLSNEILLQDDVISSARLQDSNDVIPKHIDNYDFLLYNKYVTKLSKAYKYEDICIKWKPVNN